ncbi:MAG: hypothetical protein H6732_05935 [Alphaproteobacteria bacterium]|nr:hypothetical protein [Alphaproteobacteria bacterium]
MSEQPTPTITVLHRFPDRSVRVEDLPEAPAVGEERVFPDGTKNVVEEVSVQSNGRVVVRWKHPPARGPKGTGGMSANGRRR